MLTRYLYKKSDVEKAFIAALLLPKSENGKGDKEPALFWGYELYYSGFVGELIKLLWTIYYDFYVVAYEFLEPHFKVYLQSEEYVRNNPKVIGIVIRNLLYKRPTLDVFLFTNGYISANDDVNLEINRIISEINSADLSKHYELDTVLTAIARYVMVSDDNIWEFKKAIRCYPHLEVLGMKRILIAICASYKYMKIREDLENNPQVILKTFKELAYYETVTSPYGFSLLAKVVSGESLLNHKECIGFICGVMGSSSIISDVDANASIETIIHTPFWQSKIHAYGGQITATTGIVWPDDDDTQEAAFDVECDYDLEEQPLHIQQMRVLPLPSPMSIADIQCFIDTYYERWDSSALTLTPIIRTIRPCDTYKQCLLPLKFASVSSGAEHPLKRRVLEILSTKQKEWLCGWYLQIIDRFEITEESLAGVNYKGLKAFVKDGIVPLPKLPKQTPLVQ